MEQTADFMKRHEKDMFELLRVLVDMRTGTDNKHGIDAMAAFLAEYLSARGLKTHIVEQQDAGNILVADVPCAEEAPRRILLSGHMDTVFPADSPFHRLRVEGDVARGPGTCDMKGGLVTGIFAMLALLEQGCGASMPMRFLFSPDEEQSSRTMRAFLRKEAARAAFALVFEMAGPEGELVRTRKGKVAFSARIRGRAGHAAFITKGKVSALRDAARKIELLEEMNTENVVGEDSLSVNVGRLEGGLAFNVVPEEARLDVEARCNSLRQRDEVEAKMRSILLTPQVEGTKTVIEREVFSPPLEASATEKLYALAREAAQQAGQSVGEDFRPGCSEASFLAEAGIPVLDGLGPRGGCDHSTREYLLLSSLRERALLSALLLKKAWERGVSGPLRSGA